MKEFKTGLEVFYRHPLNFLAWRSHALLILHVTKMIKELQVASKIICKRLREKPYQRNVTIPAWQAVVEQILDGRRSGTFSWQKCVGDEVDRYVDEMDDETKLAIWESTEDVDIIPNADLDTITECLHPHVFHCVKPAIFRAVKRLEKSQS